MESVILYARVSTKEQNVKQQLKVLREYARKNRYTIKKIYQDKETGLKLDRSSFKNVLKYGNEGHIENLLILDVNRLSRDFYDSIEIEKWIIKNNIRILSVSQPTFDFKKASDRWMFRTMMAMSAYQVEDMKDKQKIGIARAKAENKYKGRKRGAKNRKEN